MASLAAAAVVISRGDAQTLNQTLNALNDQSHPLEQVVVVEIGESQECLDIAKSFGFAAVMSDSKHEGSAIEDGIRAFQGSPSWLWILHHDTAPESKALENLARAAEISPSVAVIGPKLLDWNHPIQIRQLGLTTTRTSRPFTLVEDEYDQGQFDAAGDTMAVSTAGMLVAMGLWQKTGGIDNSSPVLAQDIEFCIKARAMGFRVIVEPSAKVLSSGSLSSNLHPVGKLFGGRAEALSKAHVHLATILWPAIALPLLYLAMPLIAMASIPLNLIQKRPARILGQFSAWLYSWFTVASRLKARKSVRSLGSLTSLTQLYATTEQVSLRRQRRFEEEPEPEIRTKGIFESGAIWFALAPLFAGFGLVPQGAIYADNLRPLGRSFDSIWQATATNTQSYLDGIALPADPFNWFFTLLAALVPTSASTALGWFVFFAPALGFIGAWFLASSLTAQIWIRTAVALFYSLSPGLLLLQRDAAVVELVAFVAVPWSAYFLHKSAFAFNLSRSWRWLGLAGLSGALVAISSPVVFGFLILVGFGLGSIRLARFGVLVWFGLPGLALLAPWLQFVFQNQAFAFLSVTSGASSAPVSLYQEPAWFITLGALAVIALIGSMARLGISAPLWVLAVALLFASSYQPVAGSQSALLAITLILLMLVALGLDQLSSNRIRLIGVSLLALSAIASGVLFGTLQPKQFEFGQERQVPALVLAASDVEPNIRTLSLDLSQEQISAELIWGDGRSQDEVSILYQYFREQTEFDSQLGQLAGSLLAGNPDGVEQLARVLGVDYVLLVGDTEIAKSAKISLDSLTLLQPSGETSFGLLWSVVEKNTGPTVEIDMYPYRQIQLALLAAFALLAIPTLGSITGRRVRRVQK